MKALKFMGGSIIEVDIDNTLEALQAAVEGYIETLLLIPDQAVMIVNEEGLLKGLPVNPFASAVAGTTIVGNALIVGIDGERFADIPDKIAHQIKYKFV